jgi:hypothetical protein
MSRRKTAIWLFVAVAGVVAAAVLVVGVRHWMPRWSVIQGAVIRRDTDTRKESPIAAAQITADYGNSHLIAQSDSSGYFRIAFPFVVLPGQPVKLNFRHPDYKPLDLQVSMEFRSSVRRLIVAAMSPTTEPVIVNPTGKPVIVSNMRVRYSVNTENEGNIGSAAKIFVVTNQGNVPCRRLKPCSSDGYWKAATGSAEMDAGAGNEFRDARASCIAGPCPFTKIDSSQFAQGGRSITATALDWSDTATFLLQAEVFHMAISSIVRESYPIVFGSGLSFTVPPTAEGVCLLAELDGVEIVFPLGPDLDLSWAKCTTRTGAKGDAATYQCELNPGYRF